MQKEKSSLNEQSKLEKKSGDVNQKQSDGVTNAVAPVASKQNIAVNQNIAVEKGIQQNEHRNSVKDLPIEDTSRNQ